MRRNKKKGVVIEVKQRVEEGKGEKQKQQKKRVKEEEKGKGRRGECREAGWSGKRISLCTGKARRENKICRESRRYKQRS